MKSPKITSMGNTSKNQKGHSCVAMKESMGGEEAAVAAAGVVNSWGWPSNSIMTKMERSCVGVNGYQSEKLET